jgi:hypothetical protein
MNTNDPTRRALVRFLGVLPAAALLFRPGAAAGQTRNLVLFHGVRANFAPGIDVHVFGWAAQTPQGWTGHISDGAVAAAMRDLPGTAAGVTMVVPKGMANTINGHMDKDGVRGASVCWSEVTGVTLTGATVKVTGKLTYAENPMIFKLGDPVSLDGNKDAGEFTFTIRGGGKDNVIDGFRGKILLA